MGMSQAGRARVRWIRILVVVLGLTASRHNFPLHQQAWSSWAKTSPTLEKAKPTSKKSEGVTPSRRALESRRTDRLQARNSDSGLAVFGLPSSGADFAGLRTQPPTQSPPA